MIEPLAELIEINRSTPVVLRALVRDLDAESARHTDDGEWAVIQVVAHLGDAEERAVDRVRLMSTENAPEISGYDQEELAELRNYLAMDLAEQLDRFHQLRNERVALLDALKPDDWQRTARHSDYGTITIQELMAHMVKHDVIHLAQIARLVDGE